MTFMHRLPTPTPSVQSSESNELSLHRIFSPTVLGQVQMQLVPHGSAFPRSMMLGLDRAERKRRLLWHQASAIPSDGYVTRPEAWTR